MSVSDPIADALTKIRNAYRASHMRVQVNHSKIIEAIIRILDEENYISGYEVIDRDPASGILRKKVNVNLRYTNEGQPLISGLERVSRPGLRVFVRASHVPSIRNNTGIAVISSSAGVMVDRDARQKNVGGEFVCKVW